MNTEILQYKRLATASRGYIRSKGRNILNAVLSKNNAIMMMIAFLLGKAPLVGGMMPFGMAIYAASIGYDVNRTLIGASVMLGMILGGATGQIYVTAAGMFLFNVFSMFFKKDRIRLNFRYAVTAFISILIPEMVIVYLQGFLLYDLLKAIFHCFIVFSLMFVFRNALIIIDANRKKHAFSNEEIISMAITASIAISGLVNVQLFGMNIKNIISILAILILSFKCGSGVGAAAGVTVGLIISMTSTITPLVIGSYAFCGLLGGVLRSLGKIGTSLGFIMGNAVLTLYLNNSTEVIVYLQEIIIAIILFMLIPGKLLEIIASIFNATDEVRTDKRSYSLRIKEITVEKLNKLSTAFKELARTFSEIAETKVVADKQDISSLFDRVAENVCKDCSLCLYCWDRNFYNTYQVMFKIVECLDAKGRIEENDIPDYFIDKCERINDFIKAVNNAYEIFKVDMVWKSKISESRGLVSQQLDGLSKAISSLASEINTDIRFKTDVEDLVLFELNKAGIKAKEVIVYENRYGKYEISIFHKSCGGKRFCVSLIDRLVSDIVGRKMVKDGSECCQKPKSDLCILKLVESETFSVTTGVARATKHGGIVSGDTYTFMNTGDGKYIAALSDGMGSGHKAASQSKATIDLLEQFIDSGFDKDTAIKLINSILVMKSSEESFSTIDLSIIDLYEGEVEFVKIGAVPTYIKSSDKVDCIKSASLPAGILSHIEVELAHKKVGDGDFIIMMSDGVFDSFDKQENNGVKNYISGIKSANPQEIADRILEKAYKNYGEKPGDDMLVLVSKVWKRIG